MRMVKRSIILLQLEKTFLRRETLSSNPQSNFEYVRRYVLVSLSNMRPALSEA